MRTLFYLLLLSILIGGCQPQQPKTMEASEKDSSVQHELVEIQTDFGEMVLWLYPETPIHKEAFLNLVEHGYFNGQNFNRVIDGFVIQGGCPDLPGGFTDTSLFIPAEFHPHLKHIPGALGGGRDENPQWKTNACQFYIVDSTDRDMSRLDMKYTIFGHVINGMEVVQNISKVACDEQDMPMEEIRMQARIIKLSPADIKNRYNYDI